MINQTLPPNISINKHTPFGVRLKSAREALGMDRKEVAAQLRLHETVITMIENGEFKTDLPLTFIRGYIRNYSKLMDIPDKELHDALELLKPKPDVLDSESTSLPATAQVTVSGPAATTKRAMPANIGNFFMQLFTYLIVITLIGLVGMWWHSHKSSIHPNDNLPAIQIQTAPLNSQSVTDNKHPPESIPAADPAADDNLLPNAENPDALTPPNATDTATVTAAEDTLGAHAQPKTNTPHINSSITKSAEASIQEPSPSNKNKAAFLSQTNNRYIQILTSFIIFLIIITISMRLYATYPSNSIMAGAHPNKMPRNFSPVIKVGNTRQLTNTLSIIFFIIVISLLGFSGAWWYKNSKTGPVILSENKPVKTPQTQGPQAYLQLDADVETLAPSSNLSSVLMANFKTYSLQTMVNQLDNYIAQVAAVKFTLTDKSTLIGQFTYKKKPRRHRHLHHNNYNTNYNVDNNANNNTTQVNSVPPYYTYGQ